MTKKNLKNSRPVQYDMDAKIPTSRVLTSVREFVTIKDPGNSCLQGSD